jgi:hypothetical protein
MLATVALKRSSVVQAPCSRLGLPRRLGILPIPHAAPHRCLMPSSKTDLISPSQKKTLKDGRQTSLTGGFGVAFSARRHPPSRSIDRLRGFIRTNHSLQKIVLLPESPYMPKTTHIWTPFAPIYAKKALAYIHTQVPFHNVKSKNMKRLRSPAQTEP